MQASKIVPGKVYAIKRNDKLERFRVIEVETTTRRKGAKPNPHDHASYIHGLYVDGERGPVVSLQPDDILGEFEQYAELMERQQAERDEAKRKTEAEQNAAYDLVVLLCGLTSTPAPDKSVRSYDDRCPFSPNYGSVSVSKVGVTLLLDVLQKAVVLPKDALR